MNYAYKLEHKRILEINSETGEEFYSTKLLGFFLSEEECNSVIPLYLQWPGFKDYPNDFVIEKVEADVDEFNETPGNFKSSVFYLAHEYDDGESEHISHLGYYSTHQIAEERQTKYRLQPKFIKTPDGFGIDEYEIGKREWTEGFFTYKYKPGRKWWWWERLWEKWIKWW